MPFGPGFGSGFGDGFARAGDVLPPWASGGFVGGWASSELGVMGTTYLADGEAVPAGAVFRAGFAHSQVGRRYVCPWPTSGVVFYEGGIARRTDGAMCITTSGAGYYIGAWACTFRGEVLATEDAPDVIVGGVGLTSSGFVSMENVN